MATRKEFIMYTPISGSIQIKGDRYYMVITGLHDRNGKACKQKWISTGLTVAGNKRKAEKMLRETIAEYEEKYGGIATDAPFMSFANTWLKNVRYSVAESTYQSYQQILKQHLEPFFSSKRFTIQNVTKQDIQDFIDLKHEAGLKRETIRRMKVVLSMIFKSAIEDDLILKNPCDYVKLPKAEMQEMKFYTKDQIETLLEKIKGEEIADLVQITVGLGLRRSEVLGIKWDSIDFEHRTLTIKHTVCQIKERIESDTTKNRSSYRTFPLSDEMYQLFVDLKKQEEANAARYRTAYVRSDYVFKHENGVPFAPDFVSHKFKKLLEKYDLPRIRFHDLRHSCASYLIMNGYDLKDAQIWLGHSDIKTTGNIYAHLTDERKKQIADSISGDFFGGKKAV